MILFTGYIDFVPWSYFWGAYDNLNCSAKVYNAFKFLNQSFIVWTKFAKQINIQVYCSNIHFNIQIAKMLALQSHVWLTLFLIFTFVFDLEVKITRTDLFNLSYSQLNSSAKVLTAKNFNSYIRQNLRHSNNFFWKIKFQSVV